MLTHRTDILIVGGGLAGLQAAVTICESSPQTKVIICDLGGGASTEIMGFCAPVLEDDSVECFRDDIIRSGAGENDPVLARILAEGALQVVHDLEKIGIAFDRDENGNYSLVHSVGSTYPRVVHYKTLTGKIAVEKYTELLRQNPNVVFLKSRIVKLLKADGRICGALGFQDGIPEAYSAKAVILCTGGGAGLFGFSSWTKAIKGSGYALAHDVGAKLTGMHRIQYEPCVTVYPEKLRGFPIITTLLFEGARLVDNKGNDLLGGKTPPPKRELAELITHAINSDNDCGHGGVLFEFSGIDEVLFQNKYPEYYRKLRPFAEKYEDLSLEVKPAAHTTLGGVVINEKTETSVPGLFVAGECAGGIHGRDRIGGNAGTEVFVFGRLAGRSAVEYIHNNTTANISHPEELISINIGTSDAEMYLSEIGTVLDRYCLLGRNKKDLEQGNQELKQLKEKYTNNPPKIKELSYVCHQEFCVAELFMQ